MKTRARRTMMTKMTAAMHHLRSKGASFWRIKKRRIKTARITVLLTENRRKRRKRTIRFISKLLSKAISKT
jgi:hypothetical protein